MSIDVFSDCHLISSGGESSVYKATRSDGQIVALKVDRERRIFDNAFAAFLQKNPHPHIATLYATDECKGKTYSVSEYIRGVPSSTLSPMPALFAVRLLRGVVAGLLHLQSSGKSHGDISPENILVTGESRVVLIDCGILGMGAPRFAAPERFRGMPPSAKSDLFSVGAVLYYWLAGEPLFANDKFNSLADAVSRIESYDVSLLLHGKGNISPDILGILKPFWSGLLRLAPENRFEDFEELDEVLEIAELNLSAGEQNKEFQEELWNTTLLSQIETHERMIDARPVVFPFGARCGFSWIRRDFLHWSIASLAILVLVIVLFFVWMMIIRKTPVDQVGDSMLENTRIIPSEMGISTPIKRDSSTLPEILMGAPTPVQEKEKDHK